MRIGRDCKSFVRFWLDLKSMGFHTFTSTKLLLVFYPCTLNLCFDKIKCRQYWRCCGCYFNGNQISVIHWFVTCGPFYSQMQNMDHNFESHVLLLYIRILATTKSVVLSGIHIHWTELFALWSQLYSMVGLVVFVYSRLRVKVYNTIEELDIGITTIRRKGLEIGASDEIHFAALLGSWNLTELFICYYYFPKQAFLCFRLYHFLFLILFVSHFEIFNKLLRWFAQCSPLRYTLYHCSFVEHDIILFFSIGLI